MSALTDTEFRQLLDDKGLVLQGKAFDAALDGARRLKGDVERLKAYLDSKRTPA